MKDAFTGMAALIALASAGMQQPLALSQSVTEDLSQGRTITFTIAPKLPPIVFKLVPLVQPPDRFGNSQSTIRDIEVYREGSKQAFQHLSGCDLEEMEPPARGAQFFTAEDINFDGFKDIFLETGHGATGNISGCVWLYNPATEHFDYSEDFSNLPHFWLDPAKKIIFTFERGGMLGLVHAANKYSVENNRPVLTWSENQDWDDSTNRFHCVQEERRGNQLVVARDTWSKPGSPGGWDNVEAPCNPSDFFKQIPREAFR